MPDLDSLRRHTESVLIDALPASLKAALDSALAAGATRGELLRRVRRPGGGRNLVALAVEAYLGAGRAGRPARD